MLTMSAATTEEILRKAYGLSGSTFIGNIWHGESVSENTLQDLKVEAAWVIGKVHGIRHPHLVHAIEGKYGGRFESVDILVNQLAGHFRTQSRTVLWNECLHFCELDEYSRRPPAWTKRMPDMAKVRIHKILDGWHSFALDLLDDTFREKGWIQ